MNVIKITKKTSTKIDQLNIVVSLYCVLYDIHLSETEKTILCYFILYKVTEETKQLIFNSKLICSTNTYKNILCKFKKLKLLEKDYYTRQYLVCVDVLKEINSTVGFIIKIENT